MLRKFAVISLLAAGVLVGVAEAQFCCSDGWGGTYVGAEWLYVRSYGVDQSFAISKARGGVNRSRSDRELQCAKPDFSSGVRAWVGYHDPCYCWGVRGSYLYYDSSDRFGISGVQLLAQDTITTDLTGKSCVNYQKVSFELTGALTKCNCPFTSTGFVGVGWAQVGHKRDSAHIFVDSQPMTIDTVTFDRRYFSGIGPRAGLDFVWELPWYSCLALRATLATNLLVAKTKADGNRLIISTQGTSVPVQQLINEKLVDCYRLLPSFEAKIGLRASWACGCTDVMAELGYRADYYANALDIPGSNSNNVGFAANAAAVIDGQVEDGRPFRLVRSDVGFGGLYLGLQIGF